MGNSFLRVPLRATADGLRPSQPPSRTQTSCSPDLATRPLFSGTLPVTRAPTDTQSDLFTATATLCRMLSSLLTVPTLSPPPGTRLSASGSFPPVPPPADLSDTPTMFSLSSSPPTTDKSFLDPATAQSSSGTPSVTASSLSLRRDTPIGFLALDSVLTPRTQSLSAVDGTDFVRWLHRQHHSCLG